MNNIETTATAKQIAFVESLAAELRTYALDLTTTELRSEARSYSNPESRAYDTNPGMVALLAGIATEYRAAVAAGTPRDEAATVYGQARTALVTEVLEAAAQPMSKSEASAMIDRLQGLANLRPYRTLAN